MESCECYGRVYLSCHRVFVLTSSVLSGHEETCTPALDGTEVEEGGWP
jgi:hypothetical protein